MTSDNNLLKRTPLYASAAVMFTAAVMLWWLGRVWWCQAGDYRPWSFAVFSEHNSQHLIDPYSFTHILHGILEFWLIGLVFWFVPLHWRLVIALLIEGSWEVIENTDYVINRYREATISLNYYGDSILNSLSDIACCGLGFLIAYKIRFWKSLALFVATEAILIAWIRDSLLLNIVMLIYPLEAIKHWQAGQ
jgi:hypothetical protein